MLKCPICGRKYSYESKICLECEDYLKYSGLSNSMEGVKFRSSEFYKWNCAVFLSNDNYVFASKRLPKKYMEITTEPSSLRIASARNYGWNCETIERFRATIEKSLEESHLVINPKLVDEIVDFVSKKSDSLLIYE
ncbi:MAG: hypothetical protein ACFFBY_06945 [Promethearchaeota archaeon]